MGWTPGGAAGGHAGDDDGLPDASAGEVAESRIFSRGGDGLTCGAHSIIHLADYRAWCPPRREVAVAGRSECMPGPGGGGWAPCYADQPTRDRRAAA